MYPDITSSLVKYINNSDRVPDKMLHCSSHIVSPLRHTQLEMVGAPTKGSDGGIQMSLLTGTIYHELFEKFLRAQYGDNFKSEIDVTSHLPKRWSGRLDWLFWDNETETFTLGDLKTTNPNNLYWLDKRGIKESHKWQLSAYYWACVRGKLPMSSQFFVYYLPKDNTEYKPLQLWMKPIHSKEVTSRLTSITTLVEYYEKEYNRTGDFLNFRLSPVPERVQKLVYDKKTQYWNCKLVPHWAAPYCPYDPPLCTCSEQKVTKFGHFYKGVYIPRKGYEDVKPLYYNVEYWIENE